MTIKKEGDKYKVTAPVPYAAEEPTAQAAFEALTKLELGDLVTENKAKHAEFELEDGKAVHVVAKSSKDGKVLADLLVGKAVGSGTMVRLAGKDEGVAGRGRPAQQLRPCAVRLARQVDHDRRGGRRRAAHRQGQDGSVVIAKKTGGKVSGGTDDKWELVTSVPKVDKLDNSVPVGIASALSTFKTNDFADGAKLADTGLDAPALTVTVALKGGKSVTVLIGNMKGPDDYYVKTADAPQGVPRRRSTKIMTASTSAPSIGRTRCSATSPRRT